MRILVTSIVILACLASAERAHAYLDPGSGSLFLQLLLGGLAGLGVALKLWWQKIPALFSSRGKPSKKDAEDKPAARDGS